MEMTRVRRKASEFAPQEFISNMPDNVVTNILDRLPLQDAVRTGILSRNWRCKWTLLSQLVFNRHFCQYLLKTKSETSYVKIISRLLLRLNGAITKFFLYIEGRAYPNLDDEDIANWIIYLSKKGVKDLTIWSMHDLPVKLPSHLFSCSELKKLELVRCCFDPPASFLGFPNLLSLSLWHVQFKRGDFGEFLTRCPVLEILSMYFSSSSSKLKLLDFVKLGNLKILYFLVCNLEESMITSSACTFELLSFLPKLQQLHLDFLTDFLTCKSFTEDGRAPSSFPCLKTLDLLNIDLNSGVMLSFAFEIIRSCPNLQTLRIGAGEQDVNRPPAIRRLEMDDNKMRLLQLQNVSFICFKASEEELCLIKYLLACSPILKVIYIYPSSKLATDEQLMFAKKLLKLHRASPSAEICFF